VSWSERFREFIKDVRVEITKVSRDRVTFEPVGHPPLTLILKYGEKNLTMEQYLDRLFVTEDPRAEFARPGRDKKLAADLAKRRKLIDEGKLGQLAGGKIRRADPETVKQSTGYTIGGVPPFAHATSLPVFIDPDLLQYDLIYAAAGGAKVDPARAHWWEVLGTARWGIICHNQAWRHLSGSIKSMELASIGRRAVETEVDLLQLLKAGG